MNFVFFFPDEMRAESLNCYGNEKIRTPNYNKLAEEGVLFEQCHVQNTVCSPSRCCLITGQYVHVHGHRTLWNLVKPYEKNLFSYFKESGYDIRIYGKNDMLSQESIACFTDEFVGHPSTKPANTKPLVEFGEKGYHNFLYTPMEGDCTDHHDYQDVKAGIEFIKSRKPGDKPFVLFLPTSFPHCPYTAHEPYYSMYDESDTPELRPKGTNKPEFHELNRKHRDLDGENFKKINAVYSGMISFADTLLGELMDCLKETGLDNNTALIASSDHGDYAGDYNLVEKWPSACEDVITRVPLIIKAPNCKQGHRVNELVEMFDIMPTMLESAGIEIKHTHFARSLIPQLNGQSGDPDRHVFCEGGYNKNEPHCNEGIHNFARDPQHIYYEKSRQQLLSPESVGRATMIRNLTHKLVKRTYGDNELYDLIQDPKELNNVYNLSEYQQVKQELEGKMLDWYIATSDVVPYEEDPRGIKA